VEIHGPSVDSQFYTPTAGSEDAKLAAGTFSCSCTLHNSQPCSSRYSIEQLLDMRMQHLVMTRDELDIVILAKLSTGIHVGSMTAKSKQKGQSQRQKNQIRLPP
jgi:hypothetical protein